MKFLLVAVALVSVAVAGPTRGIVTPGVAGPAPVVDSDGKPIHVGPAIIDEFHPVHVGPAIVDEYHPIEAGPAIVDEYEPIHVGPAIVDEYHPIHVGPAIIDEFQPPHAEPVLIDFPLPEGALAPTPVAPSNTPLVQIIVNVQQPAGGAPGNPVQVIDGADKPEVDPTPVIVVEQPEPEIYEPVLVQDPIFPAAPEPVIVAPVIVAPAVVAPETLN